MVIASPVSDVYATFCNDIRGGAVSEKQVSLIEGFLSQDEFTSEWSDDVVLLFVERCGYALQQYPRTAEWCQSSLDQIEFHVSGFGKKLMRRWNVYAKKHPHLQLEEIPISPPLLEKEFSVFVLRRIVRYCEELPKNPYSF